MSNDKRFKLTSPKVKGFQRKVLLRLGKSASKDLVKTIADEKDKIEYFCHFKKLLTFGSIFKLKRIRAIKTFNQEK
jgi:hypothetical protein